MANCALSKDALMKKIMEYQFAVYELNLYLDTHPEDKDAIMKFQKLSIKYKEYLNEYAENFGPIIATQVNSENYWTWVLEPWPWEGGSC